MEIRMELCHQCNNKAIRTVVIQGIDRDLCLECWNKLVNMTVKEKAENRAGAEQSFRFTNYLSAEMENQVGLHGILPRIAPPPAEHKTILGDYVLNNIKIDRSAIGILNTGNIHNSILTIDQNITILEANKENDISATLKSLTEIILASKEATDDLKRQAIELIEAISQEALKPKEKRSFIIAKSFIEGLKIVAAGLPILKEILEHGDKIIKFFCGS